MKVSYYKPILIILFLATAGTQAAIAQQDSTLEKLDTSVVNPDTTIAQPETTENYQPYNAPPDEDKVPFGQRLVFGGIIGMQFGTVTVVDIEPIIGYKITPKLIGGIGIKYIYYEVNDPFYGNYSTNIYGGSVFGRYFILENIFAHVEYELLNLEVPNDFFPYDLTRLNIYSFLVGGGYSQQIGNNAAIGIAILYNLTEEEAYPYENPIIRIGFGIGF